MGKAKTWSSAECEAAAKAHVAVAHNGINGSGQRAEDFAAKTHTEFCHESPPGTTGTGTSGDRDPTGEKSVVWNCTQDNILACLQKFNAVLNTALNMGLSGVTHDQKVNTAVAHFPKKVKDGEQPHVCKDFDSDNEWHLFESWKALKETEKVAAPVAASCPTEGFDSDDGFLTDTAPNTSESDVSPAAGNVSTMATATKGNRKNHEGRDAAKREEAKQQQMETKIAALDDTVSTEKAKVKVIDDLKKQVQAQNMIAMLNHPSVAGNESLSKQMMTKIMDVMGIESTEQEAPGAESDSSEE